MNKLQIRFKVVSLNSLAQHMASTGQTKKQSS